MIVTTVAFPRAALVGNPSDGYHGKTIAFVFSNFSARVQLYETPELEILPSRRDYCRFASLDELCDDVNLYGYYGGIRLLKAAIKKFNEYCHENSIELRRSNFTIRYTSSIPNRLGLAGSSAIITAAMRAMCRFYEVKIPDDRLASLVLATEKEELDIPAGLQDRVAQAYNQPVYMDFSESYMKRHKGIGRYIPIKIPEELPLYVAYRTDLAEGSEILHSRLRDDYESGVPEVLAAMKEWAELTEKVRDALALDDFEAIGPLLDRNFDLRCEVCRKSISKRNMEMVKLARSVGASAKFTGSGGAIIGTYRDPAMFRKLRATLKKHEIEVIRPEIVRTGSQQ